MQATAFRLTSAAVMLLAAATAGAGARSTVLSALLQRVPAAPQAAAEAYAAMKVEVDGQHLRHLAPGPGVVDLGSDLAVLEQREAALANGLQPGQDAQVAQAQRMQHMSQQQQIAEAMRMQQQTLNAATQSPMSAADSDALAKVGEHSDAAAALQEDSDRVQSRWQAALEAANAEHAALNQQEERDRAGGHGACAARREYAPRHVLLVPGQLVVLRAPLADLRRIAVEETRFADELGTLITAGSHPMAQSSSAEARARALRYIHQLLGMTMELYEFAGGFEAQRLDTLECDKG